MTATAPRRIVVTGVSRGLGRAMAEGFIEAGHTVFGCARDATRLAALAEQYGPPHSFAPVDLADENQVSTWAEQVLAAGGAPDMLVNNAGAINRPARLWEVAPEEFSRLVDVNLKGTFFVIRHFVPAMVRAGRGVIVNFSSGWGRSTAPEVAPYCATKWAVEGLTQASARELPRGLAAVAVNPGIIDTDMLRSCFGEGAARYPDAAAWASRAVPYLLDLGPAENGRPQTVPH